jgi:hypothetical protein
MKAATVVTITEYQNRETIEVCEHLLQKAKTGEITGMIVVLQLGQWDEGICITGEYKSVPVYGKKAVVRLMEILDDDVQKSLKSGML